MWLVTEVITRGLDHHLDYQTMAFCDWNDAKEKFDITIKDLLSNPYYGTVITYELINCNTAKFTYSGGNSALVQISDLIIYKKDIVVVSDDVSVIINNRKYDKA